MKDQGLIQLLLNRYKLENIVEVSSSTPETENTGPINAFDFIDSTKFETTHTSPGWFKFRLLNMGVTIASYRIKSANHAPNSSHLKSWTLFGSNDDNNWIEIDTRIDTYVLNGPLLSYTFSITNPKGPFCFFRMFDTNSFNFANKIMFSEFDIYDLMYRPVFACNCSTPSYIFQSFTPTFFVLLI